jgi:hypothetical protein
VGIKMMGFGRSIKKRPEYKSIPVSPGTSGIVTLTTYTDLNFPPFRGAIKIQKV